MDEFTEALGGDLGGEVYWEAGDDRGFWRCTDCGEAGEAPQPTMAARDLYLHRQRVHVNPWRFTPYLARTIVALAEGQRRSEDIEDVISAAREYLAQHP